MDASKKDLTKVAPHPIRPALSFYDQDGHLMDPESLVDLTGDLETTEEGALTKDCRGVLGRLRTWRELGRRSARGHEAAIRARGTTGA